MKGNRRSFTLIELLIVVAIIAILAAIAVPNFLEAQTRSKVSRVHADMAAMATALEAYCVDNQYYPRDADDRPRGPGFDCNSCMRPLTSPVAYLTSIPQDPFNKFGNRWHPKGSYAYLSLQPAQPSGGSYDDAIGDYVTLRGWGIGSCGPNLVWDFAFYIPDRGAIYDPTNGTISLGDILRTDKGVID
jgi:type II secretion system protein G